MSNELLETGIALAMNLILQHLNDHARAADTFEGISRWWLGEGWDAISAPALRGALKRLADRGVLGRRRLPSGATLWYAASPTDAPLPDGSDGADDTEGSR